MPPPRSCLRIDGIALIARVWPAAAFFHGLIFWWGGVRSAVPADPPARIALPGNLAIMGGLLLMAGRPAPG